MSAGKTMGKTSGHERRKYYRINDEVLLHYTLPDQAADSAVQGTEVELSAGAILAELDSELNKTINLVWRDHPEAGRALGLLNRKISVLGSLLGATGAGEGPLSYTRTRVNLSGSGLAFEAMQAIPAGTPLRLQIGLLPSQTTLQLTGSVVAEPERIPGNEERYWIRVNFDDSPDAQEDLIRHVVQKHGALLSEKQ